MSDNGSRRAGQCAARAPRLLQLGVLLSSVLLLSACAGFRGAPEPVTDSTQERQDFALYLTGDVLAKFYASNDGERANMSPLAWRDAVIAARLEIADQSYQSFKNQLHAETTGLNLLTDLAALGLSGAAAVAGNGASHAFAAASTGVVDQRERDVSATPISK